MDIYSDCLKNDWSQLKSLPVLTVEQIKECDDDCIRMYLYCFYNYPEFYNYKKKKLLNRCININKENLLLYSAFIGNIQQFEYLESNNLNIQYTNKDNFNVYLMAAKNGQLEFIKHIITKNISKDIVDKMEHLNVYLMAVKYGHIDVVKFLETTDINTNSKGIYGDTAYLVASYSGHVDLLKYLGNKCNIYEENYEHDNAYDLAISFGHVEVLKYLEKVNYNIYKIDNYGYNNLQIANIMSRHNVCDYLENKFIYSGFLKICSICYDVKNDKFITCKNNHIVHLTCQQFKNRNKCLNCSFKYVI